MRLPFINFNFRVTSISFFIGFFFIPFKNKICTLIYLASGLVSYTLANNTEWPIFKMLRLNTIFFKTSFKFKELLLVKPSLRIKQLHFIMLTLLKNRPVSLIELYPLKGVQYTRSAGSKSIILKMDTRTGYSLVKLSSGLKKIFSIFSLAAPGHVAFSFNKNFKSYKAGYAVSQGKKPTVRGVAMNPIDHPHGGRTKAIKYPRTPWGKTTKFK